MNRRIIIALATAATLLGGTAVVAEEAKQKPPMHMHKSDMDHRSDADVAKEYKSEAEQLREKAQSHRKLAELYRGRTPVKGAGSYESVAKHCDQLAQYYESAVKEASEVAAELSK